MGLIANWSSVQFSRSLMSDSLRSRELHPARPLCPSPTPRVYPNSYPSSQWCHPAISSSVVSFSFCPQSLRASESFTMSQLFAWRGQRASASALPMNTQDWSHLGWTSWISLQFKGLQHHRSKASILRCSAFFTAESKFSEPKERSVENSQAKVKRRWKGNRKNGA